MYALWMCVKLCICTLVWKSNMFTSVHIHVHVHFL